MLGFVFRRAAATLMVLLVASFIVYQLTAISGDPLLELRGSRDPDIQYKIQYLSDLLMLDVPPAVRYFYWLGGAAGCLIGQCDLGIAVSRGEIPVTEALAGAIASTVQLIALATILSIIIGIAIGMTTALRQYSGYDYTVTFFAFIFYSLPIFWVAVLLKEFGAIQFNRFLEEPVIPLGAMTLIALLIAGAVTGIVGGGLKTRIQSFLGSILLSVVVMIFLNATQWLKYPSLGVVGVVLVTLLFAGVVLVLTLGFGQRRGVLIVGGMALVAAAMWMPGQYLFYYVQGIIFGGDGRKEISRAAGITGFLSGLVLVVDEALQYWSTYIDLIPLQSGYISTIGAVTPTVKRQDNLWLNLLDSYAHLILPTAALLIISVAGYTRYARASLLEVMNQDYVRTARAKGLSERVVVVRHAMRNALLPIATIVPVDITALIGGAVITEQVFAWNGMGALFIRGLGAVDVNLVMGYVMIVGLMAVIGNVIADLLYSALDPRIRIS
ncbi:MAG: ABC transporter permease [Aquiluna sp.]